MPTKPGPAAPGKSDVRAPYHGRHHPDQGDEEEGSQHIAHHGVTVGLGGIGHCRVTHDISGQTAEWAAWAVEGASPGLPGEEEGRLSVVTYGDKEACIPPQDLEWKSRET